MQCRRCTRCYMRCTRCHAQCARCRSIGECRSAPRTIRLSFSQLRVLTNNFSGFVHNPFSTPSLSMSMPKFSKVFLVFWMIFLEIFVHTQIRSLTGKINIFFTSIMASNQKVGPYEDSPHFAADPWILAALPPPRLISPSCGPCPCFLPSDKVAEVI